MAKKKKKVNVQIIKPITMKELDIEDFVVKSAYQPIVFETISKIEKTIDTTDDLIFLESEEIDNSIPEIPKIIEPKKLLEIIPEIIETIIPTEIKEPIVPEPIIEEKPKKVIKEKKKKEITDSIEIEIIKEDKNVIVLDMPSIEYLKTEIEKINKNLEKIKNINREKTKEKSKEPVSAPIKDLIEIVNKKKEIETNDNTHRNTITFPKKETKIIPEIKEPVKEKLIEEIIQDHDTILLNTLPIDTRNFVASFIEIAKNPFELRYKGIKIFDSSVNKRYEIVFDTQYIIIENGRYPYSNMRIINK